MHIISLETYQLANL